MNQLLDVVVEGLKNFKAHQIKVLDLSKLENAICGYFVVCHGTSSTHVAAISEGVAKEVKDALAQRPWRKEGFGNSEWVILDYSNVVLHVFQEHVRSHYNIEELWADAELSEIES